MGFLERVGKHRSAPSASPSEDRITTPTADIDPRWLEVEQIMGVQPGALVEFETDRDAYALAHPDVFR